MAEPPKLPGSGADPSMEDILASIRRILSEDEAPASPAPAATPAAGDVLVLDPSMMVPEKHELTESTAPEPEFPQPEPFKHAEPGAAGPLTPAAPEPQVIAAVPPPVEPGIRPAEPEPPPPAAVAGHEGALVAPEAAALAASSVGALMRTLMTERGVAVSRGGPALEDIVREELRPLLKAWLDTNLPPIVERLVRAEIERVVGRAAP